tara:strand:+ start:43 stop:975 length:933 start_codon:yes stop_codon:yes gene_type:complete
MTENEVKEVQQPEVEDIEVEVTDNEAPAEASTDDELEQYTKGVSKRINKLNARNRATEERAQQLETALQQRESEVQTYYQHALQAQQNLLAKEEENVEVKEREANELYKRAHTAGDADLMSKADSLKNEVSIQKEKIRIAKQNQEQSQQQAQYTQYPQNVQQSQQPNQQQTQQEVKPTNEALDWQSQNNWYGKDPEPTQYAYFTHVNLVNEGFEPDSEEYYSELNTRIYKVYPDLRSDNAGQKEERPAVQRVTSASVGSRQKTQGKKNGVSFTKSEVETLRGIKPYGMTDDAWLKSVAKEKQKIASREAK